MVVVVIAIMASLAALSVGGNEAREFRRDIGRLQLLLELARDQSFTKGIELGWVLDDSGEQYQFYQFDVKDAEWRSYDDKALSTRQLSADYRFTLKQKSGQSIDLVQLHREKRQQSDHYQSIIGKTEAEQKQSVTPTVIFFSDGTYTPFVLQIANSQQRELRTTLIGDGINEIQLESEVKR